VLVWYKACHHQAPADLKAIIDSGRGDVSVKDPAVQGTPIVRRVQRRAVADLAWYIETGAIIDAFVALGLQAPSIWRRNAPFLQSVM
jgi:hypothetical protein